jgi:hypothetical protein
MVERVKQNCGSGQPGQKARPISKIIKEKGLEVWLKW